MMGNNYIGLMYSEVYGRQVHAYKCIECGKIFHRIRKETRAKKCMYCTKEDNAKKIREANERKYQLIVSEAREQRSKELAEIIEDMYRPEIKNSYDEGFNAALMLLHDKVMF